MKATALEISSSYNGVKKLKWDEIYESEDELRKWERAVF